MPNLHTQTNENLLHRTSQPFTAVEEKNPRLLWGSRLGTLRRREKQAIHKIMRQLHHPKCQRPASKVTSSPSQHKASTLKAAEIPWPPPRLPSPRRALRKPPTPPSGTAVPTYHHSSSSCNAARLDCSQPALNRTIARRPRPPHQLIRGRRPDVKSDRDASTEPTIPSPKRHRVATQAMLRSCPSSWSCCSPWFPRPPPRHTNIEHPEPPPRHPPSRRQKGNHANICILALQGDDSKEEVTPSPAPRSQS